MEQEDGFLKGASCCNKGVGGKSVDLSIIIVNYRNKEKIKVCLDSIIKSDNHDFSYEIILVDNASGDDLSDLIRTEPRIKLVASYKNLGPGGGNNLGIDRANGEYILVLNPDTTVRDGTIITLLNYLRNNPDVGIVGPKQLNPGNFLQHSCVRFPSICIFILRRTPLKRWFASTVDCFQMKDFDHNSIREVDWLIGSALMFKKRTTLSNGDEYCLRFDERYFIYFEDIDICRMAWAKGLKVVYNPRAVINHELARQSAKYPWYKAIFCDSLARSEINSCIKYFLKWGLKISMSPD